MTISKLISFTILTTFILIMWGGLVHNTGSSLACPDWPLCYGKIMPVMEGNVAIEHGHRMLATLVGVLCVLQLIISSRVRQTNNKLFKLSLIQLGLVVLQGVFGGLTVLFQLPTMVSTAHLAFSMIFFATLVYNHHKQAEDSSYLKGEKNQFEFKQRKLTYLRHILLFVIGILFAQILLGAFIRHTGAGVACGLGEKYAFLCFDKSSWTTEFWPKVQEAKIHMLHRLMGLVVFLSFTSMFLFNYKKLGDVPKFKFYAIAIFSVLIFQIALGVMTVYFGLAVAPTTIHLAGAALLFALSWKFYLHLSSIEILNFGEAGHSWISDLLDLAKPKLSLLVMFTAFCGILASPQPIGFFKAFFGLISLGLVVAGAAILNCYLEREIDKKMERTKSRSIPAGRIKPITALWIGNFVGVTGVCFLAIWVNLVVALMSALAFIIYLWAYTPMKQKSPLAVFVGAIPGALPPLIGWSMTSNRLDLGGVLFFLIIFIWQLPHFLAISLHHKNDYMSGGIKIYPNLRGTNFTIYSIILYTIVLLFVSVAPFMLGLANVGYFRISMILGSGLLAISLFGLLIPIDLELKIKSWAKNYFWASIIYLPLLFIAMTFLK